VRLDSGIEQGAEIGQNFDSLLAKLIVTGRDRKQAVERARRALAEFEIDGMPTALPFHDAVMNDPAFTPEEGPFHVHTRWIETEFDNKIPAYSGPVADDPQPDMPSRIAVEVGSRRIEVVLPASLMMPAPRPSRPVAVASAAVRRGSGGAGSTASNSAASGATLVCPMNGTVVKVAVEDGRTVAAGDLIAVVEAMKMEQPVTAHRPGVVSGLAVEPGMPVTRTFPICNISEP
jgi:acetyl-CoA/propionyl-CoA carboxylase biotin carboxyl carrier protein